MRKGEREREWVKKRERMRKKESEKRERGETSKGVSQHDVCIRHDTATFLKMTKKWNCKKEKN